MSILIPRVWTKGGFEEVIFNHVSVVAGDPHLVSQVYSFDFSKALPNAALWVKYEPATIGNVLEVSTFFAPRDNPLFLPPETGASISIAGSAAQVGEVIVFCDPGCSDFEIAIQSSGTGTDAVSVILCGRLGCGGGC